MNFSKIIILLENKLNTWSGEDVLLKENGESVSRSVSGLSGSLLFLLIDLEIKNKFYIDIIIMPYNIDIQ